MYHRAGVATNSMDRELELAGIRADRAGVLTRVTPEEGATVQRGDFLARIADLDSFRVEATVSDVYAALLTEGMPVRVAVDGEPLARECQVSRTTVEGYLGVLEDLVLAFRVPVFTKRARRKVAAHPKLFFADVGVFRSLRPAGPLDRPEEIAEAALEGLVTQHLRAWIDYSGADAALFFWRTRAGSEVDFVVYGKDVFTAIEVKHAGDVRPNDLRSLRSFRDDYPEAQLHLLYRGTETLESDGIRCLSCEGFLRGLRPGERLP